MNDETRSTTPRTTPTGLTWLELARQIAAMTPERKRLPVSFCDDTGRFFLPVLVTAGHDSSEEAVPFLYGDAPAITAGSSSLIRSAPITEAPSHPTDGLVLVALDLDGSEEAPADFETATGVYYRLSEVEDVEQGRRMAWYFQQEPPAPA